MSSASLPEIRKRLGDELETILGRPVPEGDANTPLNELGVDSIGLVELLVAIEKVFGLELMDAGLTADDFRTLDRLARVIDGRLN